MSADFTMHRHVAIPMRDGIELVADIWLPGEGGAAPTLLTRTPYNRKTLAEMAPPTELVRAGFVVIMQDCRGRFDSGGEWGGVHCEVDDGYDTVEWVAAQPWSNGRVGMFGPSYMGATQWAAAISRPPHLAAIVPECCAADYWLSSFDAGGSFRLSFRIGWTTELVAAMAPAWGIDDPRLQAILEATTALRAAVAAGEPVALEASRIKAKGLMEAVYKTRPMRDNPLWHGRATGIDAIFDHERRDDAHWLRINPSSHYDAMDLPAMHIGGWYDIFLEGALAAYTGMSRQAPTQRARDNQRLIIGPWTHWSPTMSVVGELDFGPNATLDVNRQRIGWFNQWLNDGPGSEEPPVRLFVMGENVWRDEQEWPLARTVYTPWYLHGDARLLPTIPAEDQTPDRFTYDPRDPVPTLGGRLLGSGEVAGPFDQRENESRADVLVYTSTPLDAPLEITGPVKLELWVSTDAPDTDFTAVFIDVHPDGRAFNICKGAVRARHTQTAMPLVAGATYAFTIDLVATSIVLPAGHRLRLHISSSSFPEWEPNPNSGAPLGRSSDADIRVAHQTVFHDSAHPSRIILPVIPR